MRWDQLEQGRAVYFWRQSAVTMHVDSEPTRDTVESITKNRYGVTVSLTNFGSIDAATLFASRDEAFAARAKEVANLATEKIDVAKALNAKALVSPIIPAELLTAKAA